MKVRQVKCSYRVGTTWKADREVATSPEEGMFLRGETGHFYRECTRNQQMSMPKHKASLKLFSLRDLMLI